MKTTTLTIPQAASHTPGPWKAEKPGIYSADGVCVAMRHPESGPEFTANARLIAAAPALLAACKRLLVSLEWSIPADKMDRSEQVDTLRAAIAAATA